MAQITSTSPASLNVTSVADPGAWDPRLNSLPKLVDMMLWGTLSSLRKVTVPPFLMATSSEEKARPFWLTVRLAASAPTERPSSMMIAREGSRIEISFRFAMGGLAWKDRHGGRIEIARQRVQESHKIGFLLRGEAERFHQVRTARPFDAASIVMLDDLLECRHRAVVHVRAAASDLAQARCLEGVLHLEDARCELPAPDVIAGQADILEAVVGEIPPLMT